MYKICICDDDSNFIAELIQKIKKNCLSPYIEIEVTAFNDGNKLIKNKETFDLIFLDIQMPGIGGFEVAEKLASKLSKDETLLIFCTNYDSMVYKSFDYQPFHFVRKNKLDSQLPIVLKKAFDKISRDSQVYTFNSKENEIIINGKEIIYFEIYDKKIKIITTKKSYYINGSLNQIEEKVNEINFMRIHKSYIVNCDFIKNINSKGVNIYGKEGEQITLPIARGKTKIIKQKFHNFAILAGGKK